MLPAIQLRRRIGAAISLLLIVCAILTTVSVVQADRWGTPWSGEATIAADTVAPLRLMLRGLDQVRGLEALHLLVRTAAEQRALEAEIVVQRRAIDTALAQSRIAPGDGADRALGAAVQAGFAAYWEQQGRLIAASRRALTDPAAATEARRFFDRDSQATVDQLRDQLDRWWSHRETRERAVQQAQRADAARVMWLLALLGALALVAAAMLARWLRSWPDAAAAAVMQAAGREGAGASRVHEVQALIDAARDQVPPEKHCATEPVRNK